MIHCSQKYNLSNTHANTNIKCFEIRSPVRLWNTPRALYLVTDKQIPVELQPGGAGPDPGGGVPAPLGVHQADDVDVAADGDGGAVAVLGVGADAPREAGVKLEGRVHGGGGRDEGDLVDVVECERVGEPGMLQIAQRNTD